MVSFTPCIYPVIPLTAGFIGSMNTQGTKLKGFLLSVIYVFGLALTYCVLAVFASLSGKIFGQFQNNPYIFLFVANVLIFFALVMLDIIPFSFFGLDWQNQIKGRSLVSVLFLGMISGLVVGSCTAPVLGTLLLYVASQQNIIHGVSLVFVFSYGLGTSLILLGTFSGLLSHLPRSGAWLLRIKQCYGLILLVAAEGFLMKAGRLMI